MEFGQAQWTISGSSLTPVFLECSQGRTRGGGGGGVTGAQIPPFLLAWLSERSVTYEDTTSPCMEN